MYITLTLDINDISVILSHLEQGIYEEVVEVIAEILDQTDSQIEDEIMRNHLDEADAEEPVVAETAMETEQPVPVEVSVV